MAGKPKRTTKETTKPKKPKAGGKKDGDLAALAAELKQVASLDSHLEEHFELEKHPRVKSALEKAVSDRVEDIIKHRFAGPVQKDFRKVTLAQLKRITGKTRRCIYDWIGKGLPREADGTFMLNKFVEWITRPVQGNCWKVTFAQLKELTGKSRRCIYDWIRKGLPREADGNFSLPGFFGWFETYTIEKLPAKAAAEISPFQAEKMKKLRIDIAESENRLLDRGEVLAGQIARHQNLISAFTHKAEEIAMLATASPKAQDKIEKALNRFFDDVLRQQCQVGEELKLPEEKARQFEKLLQGLRPEGE